jgi:ABC-type nickel/cobalt efflux system permease component RcnA
MPLDAGGHVLRLGPGVPDAGLTFALSMFVGVGLPLATVAALVILCRDGFVSVETEHTPSMQRMSRILERLTGAMLVAVGIKEFWL